MKKLSILLVFLFLTFGCKGGSKIKGKVEDVITEQPISDVAVVATMKTDIEEDKKYEIRKTKTDKTGTFLLKALSPKYVYTITATKPGYSVNETRLSPPPEGKTRILDRTFGLVKEPPGEGVYLFVNGLYSERLQLLESHDFNRYDVHFPSASAAGQPDLFYIKKGGLGNIQSFSKSYQMYLSFFSFIDEKTYDYDVIPVLLFQRLVYRGDLLGNNVYALGVYKENNNLGGWSEYNLNSYGDFEEVPSKSWYASRSGKIPFRKYSTRLKSQNLFLVKLYNLKNGIYALRRKIDWNKYEYSFFELE